MKKFILLLIMPLTLLCQQDEKRLALVIGNANYLESPLNNPVNDARLMATTLEKLDFEVILHENIETQTEFKEVIFEFGKKRPDYDVAFVYYAGHGIQVGSENYLLPTKVNFDTENSVKFFGVNVNEILMFLNSISDQVNILVLDACRDNPYEGNWNKTRSLGKGAGLNKITPPTGSLIAFSTDAGKTAADGNEFNSIYCTSLVKNMLKKNQTVFEVFSKVREEVELKTNGHQSPVEENKLTGERWCFSGNCKPKKAIDFIKIFDLPDGWIDYTKRGGMKERIEQMKKFSNNPENIDEEFLLSHLDLLTGLQYTKYDIDSFPGGLIPEIKVFIRRNQVYLVDMFYDSFWSEDSLKNLKSAIVEDLSKSGIMKNIEISSLTEIEIDGHSAIESEYIWDYKLSNGGMNNPIDDFLSMTFKVRSKSIYFSYSGLNYELSFIDILPDPSSKKYTWFVPASDYSFHYFGINDNSISSSENEFFYELCKKYDEDFGTNYSILKYNGEKLTNMGKGDNIISSFQNGYNCHCPEVSNINLFKQVLSGINYDHIQNEDGDFIDIKGVDSYGNQVVFQFYINETKKQKIKIPFENGSRGDDCSKLFTNLIKNLKFD